MLITESSYVPCVLVHCSLCRGLLFRGEQVKRPCVAASSTVLRVAMGERWQAVHGALVMSSGESLSARVSASSSPLGHLVLVSR
jgi:hypothetical protein